MLLYAVLDEHQSRDHAQRGEHEIISDMSHTSCDADLRPVGQSTSPVARAMLIVRR